MIRASLVVLALSGLTLNWSPDPWPGQAPHRDQSPGRAGVSTPAPSGDDLVVIRPPAPTYREIRNVMGRCLEVAGGITANRNKVQISDCNGTMSQQWTFTNLQLRNKMGRCLDVADGVNANQANVQIFDCYVRKSQQWAHFRSGRHLGFRSALGGCLDVAGGVNANSTRVQMFECNGSPAQQWRRNAQVE